MINLEYIKELKPCKNRLANYIEHYRSFTGGLSEFLDLDKITHKDKLWVYFRSIPKEIIGLVVADFAENVLHIYESKYPNNKASRLAIEAARSTTMTNQEKRAAAYAAASASSAADAAADAAAAYAADAAYAAAAYAADAAAYAADAAADADAAAYAAADAAADAAAYAAYAAYADAAADAYAAARSQEKKFQIETMKKWINE